MYLFTINATILLHAPFTIRVADHCRNLVAATVIPEVPSLFSPYTKLFPFHHIVFPLFQAPVRCVLTMLSSSFLRLLFLEAKQYFLCSDSPPFKIMYDFQIYVLLLTLNRCIPLPSLNSNAVFSNTSHISKNYLSQGRAKLFCLPHEHFRMRISSYH